MSTASSTTASLQRRGAYRWASRTTRLRAAVASLPMSKATTRDSATSLNSTPPSPLFDISFDGSSASNISDDCDASIYSDCSDEAEVSSASSYATAFVCASFEGLESDDVPVLYPGMFDNEVYLSSPTTWHGRRDGDRSALQRRGAVRRESRRKAGDVAVVVSSPAPALHADVACVLQALAMKEGESYPDARQRLPGAVTFCAARGRRHRFA